MCGAGRYQSSIGQIDCSRCIPGRYGPSTGLSSCFDCEAGYSAGKYGAVSCERCISPQLSLRSGAANCSLCEKGYFKNTLTGECVACHPDEATCDNGTTLLTINVNDGWYRFASTSALIYPCTYPENCLGGSSAGFKSCSEVTQIIILRFFITFVVIFVFFSIFIKAVQRKKFCCN